jgi:predicted acyl esterase
MKTPHLRELLCLAGLLAAPGAFAQSANPEQPMIEDKVGAAAAAQLEADKKAVVAVMPDHTLESVMVPMRDGVKLCTEVFLPKDAGAGPWPVVLQRSPYTRWDPAIRKTLNRLVPEMRVVVILQNQRGRFGSEGAGTFPQESFDNEINDSADTIDWIAKQPWSNQRVGMVGVSGSGLAGANAVWSGSSHLVAVSVSICGDNAYDWIFSNGVRRYNYGWLSNRGVANSRAPWPSPVTISYDPAGRKAFIAERGAKTQVPYINTSGWYDIFNDSLLDAFAALAPNGKTKITMDPGGHGGTGGEISFPLPRKPPTSFPTFKELLSGAPGKTPERSELVYYLMGDARDPEAPGNVWKVTDKWPVPSRAVSYHLRADGQLSTEPSGGKDALLSYDYDPRDPVPTHGGNWQFGKNNGPHDQRPLKERKDVLRFVTEPLTEPVGITGKVFAELSVSTDAPDTTFVATLVDIYPDGYESLVRQGAMMARYWQGLDKPAPLEPGRVYKLGMDLYSTALVFNKGHRIGLLVTSSSSPAFEVHPNTYEQVTSIEEAKVARQNIHLSAEHGSRLILPVIEPETYQK